MPILNTPTLVDHLEAERDSRSQAGRVRRLRGGRLVTNPRFPAVLRANQVLVGATEPPVDWGELRLQSEPTFRAARVHGRRVMLFGDEAHSRLAAQLSGDGFRERPLWLSVYRGWATAHPNPDVAIRLVDPFLRPAWFTLSYRVEEENARATGTANDRASLYASLADRPGLRTFAGFLGDSMAGTCDLHRIGSMALVEHVQTAPEWRGQGVATTLVLRATEEAVRDGARGVQLTTNTETLADQLYRPCGFERVARLAIFERDLLGR